LKLYPKDTVDRLQLELLQAKGVGTNVSQTRVRGDDDTTTVVVDEVTRVLHQETGTPFISGVFDSPAITPQERSDQGRGLTHIHSMDSRVRDSPAMASPEARSDQVRRTAQDRGVGAGMMLSPQQESSGQT
jgi:hypothetical protein